MMDTNDHDLLIRIEQRVASIDECLKGLDGWQKSMDDRLRDVEFKSVGNEIRTSTVKSDVDTFKNKSNTIDVILGVITILGAILGSIFGTR